MGSPGHSCATATRMWARARGWALWKAILGLAESDCANPHDASNLRIVADLIAEHARTS